jgi:hypothetical protein
MNFGDIIKEQYAEFDALIDNNDPLVVISLIPIKTTKIPARVSKILGFDSFEKMKQAVLKHMNDGGPVADALLNAVKTRLPVLSA